MGEAAGLNVAGVAHAFADGGRGFAYTRLQQFFFAQTRHFDVEVNTVKQGAGDAFLVLGYRTWRATALTENVDVLYSFGSAEGRD